ncbi:MAG: hypothetical protein K6B68_09680 [Eubacterium sp.]|nr:hypothetical protein [Eubacterium sp.]
MNKYIFIEGFSTDKVLEEKEEMLRRMPGYRVEKALKIKNKEAMAQSIVAGRLLVKTVSQKLCISEEESVRLLDSESHSVEDIIEIKVYGEEIFEKRLSGEIISRGYEMAGRRYQFYTYDVSTEYAFTVCVDIKN